MFLMGSWVYDLLWLWLLEDVSHSGDAKFNGDARADNDRAAGRRR